MSWTYRCQCGVTGSVPDTMPERTCPECGRVHRLTGRPLHVARSGVPAENARVVVVLRRITGLDVHAADTLLTLADQRLRCSRLDEDDTVAAFALIAACMARAEADPDGVLWVAASPLGVTAVRIAHLTLAAEREAHPLVVVGASGPVGLVAGSPLHGKIECMAEQAAAGDVSAFAAWQESSEYRDMDARARVLVLDVYEAHVREAKARREGGGK